MKDELGVSVVSMGHDFWCVRSAKAHVAQFCIGYHS